MKDPLRNPIEIDKSTQLDELLKALSGVDLGGPSPRSRQRLSQAYKTRYVLRPGGETLGRRLRWPRPIVFWAALPSSALALVILLMTLIGRPRQRINLVQHDARVPKSAPVTSQEAGTVGRTTVPAGNRNPRSHRYRTARRQMIIARLPYSNDAISTGTSTVIRISVSQTELVSLGLPVGDALKDRQIIAELMLGDDGLPRAIGLPLPVEIVREKR